MDEHRTYLEQHNIRLTLQETHTFLHGKSCDIRQGVIAIYEKKRIPNMD
jgi:hypothetical protein